MIGEMAQTQYLSSSNLAANQGINNSIISVSSNPKSKLNSILFKPTITKKIVNKASATLKEVDSKLQKITSIPIENSLKSYKIEDEKKVCLNQPECKDKPDNQQRKKLKYSSEDSSNQEDYEDCEEDYIESEKSNGTHFDDNKPSSQKIYNTQNGGESSEIKKERKDKLKLNTVSMKNKRKKLIMKKFKNNEQLTEILLNLTENTFDIFNSLLTIEHDFNGGAKIITCKYDDLVQKLGDNKQLIKQFANYFLNLCYCENEKTKRAEYTLGIVHNCAANIPDILEYFGDNYPTMNVKSSLLTNTKDIQTLKMKEYKEKVFSSYYNGTYRYGPLLQTSIVGM